MLFNCRKKTPLLTPHVTPPPPNFLISLISCVHREKTWFASYLIFWTCSHFVTWCDINEFFTHLELHKDLASQSRCINPSMLLQLLLIKWYQLALSEIINTAFGILVVFLLLHVFNVWCLGLKLMKRIHLHFSFKLDFGNGENQRAYSAFIYCLVLCVQRRRTTQEVWF